MISSAGPLADLYALDTETSAWTTSPGPFAAHNDSAWSTLTGDVAGSPPSARTGHGVAEAAGRICVFGGLGFSPQGGPRFRRLGPRHLIGHPFLHDSRAKEPAHVRESRSIPARALLFCGINQFCGIIASGLCLPGTASKIIWRCAEAARTLCWCAFEAGQLAPYGICAGSGMVQEWCCAGALFSWD